MVEKEVEAILFAAGRAVTLDELSRLLDISEPGLIKEAIKDIKRRLTEQESPIVLLDEGQGWKLAVREKYFPYVHQINTHTDLPFPVMETLAVISWKQPILQSDVIRIRSTKAYEHIQELEEKGFITRQRHGRSYVIKVTQKFLDYFDLPDAKAVRELFKDFTDIEPQKKLDQAQQEEPTSPEPSEPHIEIYERTPDALGQETQESAHVEVINMDGLEVYESSSDVKESQGHHEEHEEQPLPEETPSQEDDDEGDNKALELAKKIVEESDLEDTQDKQENPASQEQDKDDDAEQDDSSKSSLDHLV